MKEDGEEDDEESRRQEDVLERVVLVQNGDQGEADCPAQAAVRQNKLLLCRGKYCHIRVLGITDRNN